MKKLAKFHYNENEGKVVIKIVDRRQDDKTDVTVYESNDRPLPVLERKLQEMKRHLMDFCELPEEWEDDITVLAVSAKYAGNGSLGVTISGKRDLEGSNRPLVINSPYFHEEQDEEDIEGAELGIFGPELKDAFKELERLAFDFINGSRQQLPLFKPEPAESELNLPLEADPISS